jgi:hypothetical protein
MLRLNGVNHRHNNEHGGMVFIPNAIPVMLDSRGIGRITTERTWPTAVTQQLTKQLNTAQNPLFQSVPQPRLQRSNPCQSWISFGYPRDRRYFDTEDDSWNLGERDSLTGYDLPGMHIACRVFASKLQSITLVDPSDAFWSRRR